MTREFLRGMGECTPALATLSSGRKADGVTLSFVTGVDSTFSAAASRILERFFGTDDIEFTVKSEGLPGAVRTFKKLSDCRKEVGMSRLWGGIHVMSDNLAGTEAGLKIGDWVFDHALQAAKD